MQTDILTGFRLSPQQRVLWAHRGGADADIARAVIACGTCSAGDVRRRWETVAQRHSIARTRLVLPHGVGIPLQVVGDSDEGTWDATVATSTDGETVLVVTMPAALTDAGSVAQLAEEVNRECAPDGDAPDYTAVAMLLEEIAGDVDEGRRSAADAFWSAQLDAMPFRLPWQRQRAGDGAPASVACVAGTSSVGLEACASALGVSPDAVVTAAWTVMAARFSGDPACRFGIVLDGRADGLDGIMGPLDRVVPIAPPVSATDTFADVIRSVADLLATCNAQEMQANWDARGDSTEREAYVLEYERRPASVLTRRPAIGTATLWIVSVHSGDRLTFEAHFDSTVLAAAHVVRVLDYFDHLLAAGIADLHRAARSLPMIDAAERRRLMRTSRHGDDAPRPACIHERIAEQARRQPDAIAVRDEHESLTYAVFDRRANQLAHLLRSCGAGPESRVVLCLERSASAILAVVATWKAGAAYVPLMPSSPADRLHALLAEADPVAVVGDAVTLAHLGHVSPGVHVIDIDHDGPRLAAQPSAAPTNDVQPEHLAYLLFTSGSTGQPKAVAVEHRQLARYVESIEAPLDLASCRSFAIVTTLAADLGHTALYPALAGGATLHIISPALASDAAGLAEYFEQNPVDCLKIVPSHLHALLEGPDPGRLIPRRVLVLGGEPCPWPLVAAVRRLSSSTRIVNHYGPTETTVGALANTDASDGATAAATVPIGRPLPHADALVLDERLEPSPVGVPGELYIGGRTVTRGYFGHPDLTAERYVPDPRPDVRGERLYRTGDLVRRWEDGSIEFLRRIDRQVKIRGFRVEPAEVEASLRCVSGVAEAVVLVDEQPTASLRAFVTAASGASLNGAAVRAQLARILPDHMVPAIVHVLQFFPLTTNGKIDRRALAERAARSDVVSHAAPETAHEQAIAAIWAELLRAPRIGLDDNFFDLGGHSLLMVQVHARLERQWARRLSMVDLFRHTTVRSLAAFVCREEQLAPNTATAVDAAVAARRTGLDRLRDRRHASASQDRP